MARVRSRDSALGRLLAAAPGAIYALDDQRRIIYGNAALGELLGVDPDELMGQRCDYRTVGTGSAPADMAASLCPQPEAFAGIAAVSELQLLHASGRLLNRPVAFHPLGADVLHCVGVLAFVGELAPALRPPGEREELHQRLWELRRQVLAETQVDELIGISPAIRRVREQIELMSRGPMRVVVHGPSGSGREHVARLLHRRANPSHFGQLVPIFCPLLGAELLQTTITSLVRQSGMLNAENQSQSRPTDREPGAPTLLLLEVDQLNQEAQAELSGFFSLPNFELYAVATSEESLIDLARRGGFRNDLAYALSTLTIELPALAQRRQDIPLLSQYFLEKFNAQGERQLSGFSSEALDELAGYHWPENVDELAEIVELACRQAEGTAVEVCDLPDQIQWAHCADAHPPKVDEPIDLDAFLAGIEKELIVRALRRSKGNKTRAAQLLGINRARFHRRLEHFEIARV